MQSPFSTALGPDFDTELLQGVTLGCHGEYVGNLNLIANLNI